MNNKNKDESKPDEMVKKLEKCLEDLKGIDPGLIVKGLSPEAIEFLQSIVKTEQKKPSNKKNIGVLINNGVAVTSFSSEGTSKAKNQVILNVTDELEESQLSELVSSALSIMNGEWDCPEKIQQSILKVVKDIWDNHLQQEEEKKQEEQNAQYTAN